MRIERVDDTTIKLLITYSDVEVRELSCEDLWTNRKHDGEFFWSMVDEINEEEDFAVEGPLRIQVHAFEKDVKIVTSKSKDENTMNMSDDNAADRSDEQVQELLAQTLEGEDQLEELFEQRTKEKEVQGSERQESSVRRNTRIAIVKSNDLEDAINYAHRNNPITIKSGGLLYIVDGIYYCAVHLDSHVDQEVINDSYSQLLESTYSTDRAEVYLNNYAKIVMNHNVTAQARHYFLETTE